MFAPAEKYNWKVNVSSASVKLKSFKKHKGLVEIVSSGKLYARLLDDTLTVYEDYNFDGCTCAPDFERALRGCCFHDALYQMLRENDNPFPKKWADKALLEIQRKDKFMLSKIYFFAVAIFGGLTLSGCQSRPADLNDVPAITHTVDIYVTDQGFFVITERGSDESIAYRFNTQEIYQEE